MFVMGGLVLIALVVGLGLWMNMTADSTPTVAPTTTLTTATTLVAPSTTALPGAGTVVPIAAVTSFDPDGTDKEEHPEQVQLAVDGDPSTGWTTVCYKDRYVGGKRGVGLVVELGAVHTGTVTVSCVLLLTVGVTLLRQPVKVTTV